MCGEKDYLNGLNTTYEGSPPRVRGKAYTIDTADPATRDHPRVRGEKFCASSFSVIARGSPPRARGKVDPIQRYAVKEGITPACAGKRGRLFKFFKTMRDHPRVRGEKTMIGVTSQTRLGSPPRARGKGFRCSRRRSPARITPACAGKSIFHLIFHKSSEDHPRVCGEKEV